MKKWKIPSILKPDFDLLGVNVGEDGAFPDELLTANRSGHAPELQLDQLCNEHTCHCPSSYINFFNLKPLYFYNTINKKYKAYYRNIYNIMMQFLVKTKTNQNRGDDMLRNFFFLLPFIFI